MQFTCLSKEQIRDLFNVGEQRYNPGYKPSPCAYITDFAIFLGGRGNPQQKNRIGSWLGQVLAERLVTVINHSGVAMEKDLEKIDGTAIRISIDTSNIGGIGSKGNWKFISKGSDFAKATFGEMPQDKIWCGSPLEKELKEIYSSNNISYTKKVYKFYYQNKLIEFKEFVHQGKKYIVADTDFRKKNKHPYNDSTFSDGVHVEKANLPIFFQVKPIEWTVNVEKEIAYTDKLLFSSFPIKYQKDWSIDTSNLDYSFEDTNLYEFLNNEFKENITLSITNSAKIDSFNLEIIPNLDEITKIKNFIESDIPVFLHGKSGDGKSARVKQLDPNCVVLYMRNATPESLVGKSIVSNTKESLVDIPPTWYLKLKSICERDPEDLHILFFDELTNALPSIQSMAFNIVLKKEVNGKWKLPENARIIAAGNEMEDSLAANELAEPLYGRFAHVTINTEVDNWCIWALRNNIHPLIVLFIKLKGYKVLRSKYTGLEPNADPRKWEMASRVLYNTNNPNMLNGLIGKKLTKEFINFITLKTYQLDDIISDRITSDKLASKDEIYLTIYALSFVKLEDLLKVSKFMKSLGDDEYELFKLLWKYNHKEFDNSLDETIEENLKTKKLKCTL